MKKYYKLTNNNLANVRGGWNKSAFDAGKRVGRVAVFAAGFTPWGKVLRYLK
ncbi:hypothetical protein [Companilactobacillus formosensis]|uniref:hypothetical protein n=1 Tax=Companilactobacillus formosensis TaxID=1617889 RepID=UPI0013C30323|nr:hypothetical protein [Companilactobacillus formosensis]